jgi:hypothetical protein
MDDDGYWVELAEAAAKEAFEATWAEGLRDEFEPWQKEASERLYLAAFMEGAIFCANISGTKLPLIKPEDPKDDA